MLLLECDDREMPASACSIVVKNVRTNRTLARADAPRADAPAETYAEGRFGAGIFVTLSGAPLSVPTIETWTLAPLARLALLAPRKRNAALSSFGAYSRVAISPQGSQVATSSCRASFDPDGPISPTVCDIDLFGAARGERVWTQSLAIAQNDIMRISFAASGAVEIALYDQTTTTLDSATGKLRGSRKSPWPERPTGRWTLPRGELSFGGLQGPRAGAEGFVYACRYSTSAGQVSVVPAELCELADGSPDATTGSADPLGGWMVALAERGTTLVVLRLD